MRLDGFLRRLAAVFLQRLVDGFQEAHIQIILLGEGGDSLADLLDQGLALGDDFPDPFPGLVVFPSLQHIRHRPGGQFLSHHVGLWGVFPVVQEDNHANRHQEIEDVDDGIPPGGQKPRHLLLVGALRRAGNPVPQPGAPVDDHVEGHHDDHGEDIEIPELAHVEGIEETLPRHPVLHHRNDLLGPGELDQDEDDKANQQGIENHPLEGVGDDQGQRPSKANQGDRQCQEENHQRIEGGDAHPTDGKALGKIQHPDEKPRRNGGHDHVGDHLRQGAQGGGENPEGAAVPNLQELPQAHRLRLPETVGHEARQRKEKRQRRQHRPPEPQGKARLVSDFHKGHQAYHRKSIRHLPHVQHIPAADTAADQEIRDPTHIATGVKAHEHHKGHRDDQNRPVP